MPAPRPSFRPLTRAEIIERLLKAQTDEVFERPFRMPGAKFSHLSRSDLTMICILGMMEDRQWDKASQALSRLQAMERSEGLPW